jgi:hypothetical protein
VNLNDWIELIKSSVRPFIIIWGFMIYGICVMTGVEVPQLLAGLVTAVVLEYFGERAYQRLREKEE